MNYYLFRPEVGEKASHEFLGKNIPANATSCENSEMKHTWAARGTARTQTVGFQGREEESEQF
jgi:hypothetical protein